MSRIETLRKQFPHLTISLFDVLIEIDGTKTHKYSQLLCKLFDGYLKSESDRYKEELDSEVHNVLNHLSVPLDKNFNTNFMKRRILDNVRHSDVELFQTFKSYMEKGLIKETDITKYSNFTQLSAAVSLAELREFEKSSELKVHKEFEDDKWLLVRPLSFEASAKYGAGTKWCTTFKREKEYFFKYCQNGILLYIINKESGEKFAMFYDMTIEKAETSFWDVEDKRNDITDLEIDTYLYEEIKKIILANDIDASKEKTKEKITNNRENKGIVFKKKEAIKLFMSKTTREKVGNRKREVAEANCPSPQGNE